MDERQSTSTAAVDAMRLLGVRLKRPGGTNSATNEMGIETSCTCDRNTARQFFFIFFYLDVAWNCELGAAEPHKANESPPRIGLASREKRDLVICTAPGVR